MKTRRRFLCHAGIAGAAFLTSSRRSAASDEGSSDRFERGLLLGGLIGDALGGPFEFVDRSMAKRFLPTAAQWKADVRLTDEDFAALSDTVPMIDYRVLRPEPAAYGPWRAQAPAGTLTDDSRHKIVLMQAMKSALQQESPSIERADIAKQFLRFAPRGLENQRRLQQLNEEGFREYRLASRWVLGERELERARPVERLWAGVANCSGQMMFPPLAALFPGAPEEAYLATFSLNFIDAPIARDITASLVAAIAAVLDPARATDSPAQRWQLMRETLGDTDPYRFAEVPYAGRPWLNWLEKSAEFAERADRRPDRLFAILETEGAPKYWWDAHYTLLVPLTMLHFCRFDPLAAMHLILAFGHDTDSYAQVLGCLAGAVHGESLFPDSMRTSVTRALWSDYGESVDEWQKTLAGLRRARIGGAPAVLIEP